MVSSMAMKNGLHLGAQAATCCPPERHVDPTVSRPENGSAALRSALWLLMSRGANDYLFGRERVDGDPAVRTRDRRGSDQPRLRHFEATRRALGHPECRTQRAARLRAYREHFELLPRRRANLELSKVWQWRAECRVAECNLHERLAQGRWSSIQYFA